MLGSYKSVVAAAGAVALLSSQAAYAAPSPRIDPLVALSALGTAQSRMSVCAAGASAAAAGAATAAAQGAAPGCVLPVTAPPAPVPAVQGAPLPVVETGAAPQGIGMLPALLGLIAVAAAAVLLLDGDDDNEGNLSPVSPG